MNLTHISNSALSAFVASTLVFGLVLGAYFAFEPVVSRSATDVFLVQATITSEISFNASTSDVTMLPSILGTTGGTATGQTQVVVTTNNSTGYYMTLGFSTSTAMQGDSNGGVIQNYTPTSGVIPDYTFTVGANTGEFAYSVAASSTADIDTTFRNNGAVCNNNSGGDVADRCWAAPSTTPSGVATPETIITTTAQTPTSGSTSTVKFQIEVTSSPSPAIPNDTYTATATLTALVNP